MNWLKWTHIPLSLVVIGLANILMGGIALFAAPGYGQTSGNITVTVTPTYIEAPTVTNGAGATSITSYGARLNGEITDNGGENPTAYIYWGGSDGADNASAWQNVEDLGIQASTFYFDADNCTDNSTYFYRASGTNSGGTGWASSTANFTTLFAMGPPASVNLTDLGAITILAVWSLGENATETEIRIKRDEAPTSVTDGERFYSGNLSTANMSGFDFTVNRYVVSAWGKTGDTYSDTYVTANIGGEDMEAVGDAITALTGEASDLNTNLLTIISQIIGLTLVIIIIILAFWQKSQFLFIVATPVSLTYGLAHAANSTVGSAQWVTGVMVAIIGTFCLFKVAIDNIARVARRR